MYFWRFEYFPYSYSYPHYFSFYIFTTILISVITGIIIKDIKTERCFSLLSYFSSSIIYNSTLTLKLKINDATTVSFSLTRTQKSRLPHAQTQERNERTQHCFTSSSCSFVGSQFTTLDIPAPRRCLVLHPRDNTTVSRVKGSQGDRHNVKFQRYRRSAHILLPSLLWKVSPDLNSTAKLSACFNFRIFFFPRCLFDCLSIYLCIVSFTGRLFPDDTDRHRDSGKHFK